MIKNLFKVLCSNFIVVFIGLISSFLFPKIMSIDQYADYQVFMLYLSYITFLHLGIPSGMYINYGGMSFQEIDKKKYKSEILLATSVLAFFTVIAVVVSVLSTSQMLFYISLAIIPYCIVSSYKSLYQSWNMFSQYSLLNALTAVSITIIGLIYYLVNKNLNGKVLIYSNLGVYLFATIFIYLRFWKDTNKIKSNAIFSMENFSTLKVGFLVMCGNYINVLFQAIDKQFVNIFYDVHSFAMYAFAMSTQKIMTVFITSLAQPFYPKLAKGELEDSEYSNLKELLFIFGSFSGCACFAVSFIITKFLPKYNESVTIIEIFFAVFPAMAVINVLYINLYKITKQMKKYIFSMMLMLVIAVVFNSIVVVIKGNYTGIAIATMLVYYIWLVYSSKDFSMIHITIKDISFILCYLAFYFVVVNTLENLLGIMVYSVGIILINMIFHFSSIRLVCNIVRNKVLRYN